MRTTLKEDFSLFKRAFVLTKGLHLFGATLEVCSSGTRPYDFASHSLQLLLTIRGIHITIIEERKRDKCY